MLFLALHGNQHSSAGCLRQGSACRRRHLGFLDPQFPRLTTCMLRLQEGELWPQLRHLIVGPRDVIICTSTYGTHFSGRRAAGRAAPPVGLVRRSLYFFRMPQNPQFRKSLPACRAFRIASCGPSYATWLVSPEMFD